MTRAVTKLGTCQVRSETDRPCLRPAVVEIRGVPFCERCARDQEAYFAIGELTQGPASDRRLAKVLNQLRWKLDERFTEAGKHLKAADQEAQSAEGTSIKTPA